MKSLFEKYPSITSDGFKKFVSLLPLFTTTTFAIVGSGVIPDNRLKWTLLIFSCIIAIITFIYNREYGELIGESEDNIRKNEIKKFAQEINSLTSHFSEKWNAEKANLFSHMILNSAASTLETLGVKDVRVSLYGTTKEEKDDSYTIDFIKCSKNTREPNNKNFSVNDEDPFQLFDVLEKNTPTYLERPSSHTPHNSTPVSTNSRHWKHSLRFPVSYTPHILNSQESTEEITEKYLFIVDTSEDEKIPEFTEDILKLSAHLYITALHQSSLLAQSPVSPSEFPQ